MWSKPFTSQVKLGVGGSLLMLRCCARGGAYRESVSQPSLPIFMWILSHFTSV